MLDDGLLYISDVKHQISDFFIFYSFILEIKDGNKLRNPFTITLKKEVNPSGRYILEEFEESLSREDCLKFKMISSRELVISNEFICFPRDWLWNAWMGIAGVRITKHDTKKPNYQLIKYTIDETWNILVSIILFLVFTVAVLNSMDTEFILVYFMFIVPAFTIASGIGFGIQIWMQWTVFTRIIKYGPTKAKLGNYNWPKIMRRKTDEELQQIIAGKNQLPQEVINIAREELEKRN